MKQTRILVVMFLVGFVCACAYTIKSRAGIDVLKTTHLKDLVTIRGVLAAGDEVQGVLGNVTRASVLGNVTGGYADWTTSEAYSAKDSWLTVDVQDTLGEVNRLVYGNNALGHYSRWKPHNQFSDYGAGFWDPKWDDPVDGAVGLANSIGISCLRFPGGCGANFYDWKKAIGRGRKEFLFGIDEFMALCLRLKAEPVITVSYFTGDERDAADLVEYLNSPDDGKHPWAAKRAANGHKQPYGVKYFEIGNEVYNGNKLDVYSVDPHQYAMRYLDYYKLMKAVDDQIKIGVVFSNSGEMHWNESVANVIQGKTDFSIVHLYPRPAWGEKLETIPVREIFEVSLAQPQIVHQNYLRQIFQLFKQSNDELIPVAVTEFNGGFVQEKPVPYRHVLGCALINAELLRILMKPENNILFANHWNFINEYWGMVSNGFRWKPDDLYKPHFKRPNYYTFEMYNKHFGDMLLRVEVESPTYDVTKYQSFQKFWREAKGGKAVDGDLLSGKWRVAEVPGVTVSDDGGVVTLKFENIKDYNYYHCSQTVPVEPDAYYRVSGYIRTKGLVDRKGFSLEVQDARGWTKTRSAMSTGKVLNSEDWMYVQTVYRTLKDASAARVIIRRAGNEGPLSGVVQVKDVKLEKFVPDVSLQIPYLSVNASKSADGKTVYLMVVNKNIDNAMTATIDLKNFVPADTIKSWTLNGPSIDATNEENHNNVRIKKRSKRISGSRFKYTFEPHSLTAIELYERD